MNAARLEGEKSNMTQQMAQYVEENSKLIAQASTDIRTMSYLFHPPSLDEMGLHSALNWYVGGFAQRSNIGARWQRLPKDYELCLFRIAQECLTNIHRYSGGTSVQVRLLRLPGEVKLEVIDAGRGIKKEALSNIASGATAGVGLRGMRERVRQLGGSLEVRSNGKGATVIATVPFVESPTDRDELVRDQGDRVPTAKLA